MKETVPLLGHCEEQRMSTPRKARPLLGGCHYH
jgi:hypothetical protein